MTGETSSAPRVIEVRADDDEAVSQATDAQSRADRKSSANATGGGAPTTGKPATADEAGKPAPQSTKPAASPSPAPVVATAPAAAPPTAAKAASKPAAKGGEGLGDEMLTQIAQAKFEAQEDKLRDVARQSMALLRDYGKLNAAEADRRVAEIRKSLLKYEQQYVRAWSGQEQRRRLETKVLEAEAERCHQEAEEEGSKYIELRQALERERRRRKRYEHYERLAEEVARKKSRSDSQAQIASAAAEIERVNKKRVELEALAEVRNQRAQLLRHAAAELKDDLRREQHLGGEVLGATSAQAGQPDAVQPGSAAGGEVVS